MTKYILSILDDAEGESGPCDACAGGKRGKEGDPACELTWAEADSVLKRFRTAVHYVFGFAEEFVTPVYIKDASYPLRDAAFDCKGYTYKVRKGELACVGKVIR